MRREISNHKQNSGMADSLGLIRCYLMLIPNEAFCIYCLLSPGSVINSDTNVHRRVEEVTLVLRDLRSEEKEKSRM